MYTQYKRTVKFLEALGPAALSNEKKIDTFSQVTDETNRLVEIMDIQDELKIVESVLMTQKKVLQMLEKQIRMSKKGSSTALRETGAGICVAEALKVVDDQIKSVSEMETSAQRVQEDVSRLFLVEEMATNVALQLKQLLEFKQQQSNAWETRFARKLAEQGQKQNNVSCKNEPRTV